jgi:hypothetical protein
MQLQNRQRLLSSTFFPLNYSLEFYMIFRAIDSVIKQAINKLKHIKHIDI